MFLKSLKAGSLQLVIGVVSLVAIMLFMLLLYINVMNKVQQSKDYKIAAIHQLDYLDDFLVKPIIDSEITFDLGKDKSIQMNLKPWGIYSIGDLKSNYKSASFTTKTLIGNYNPVSDSLVFSLSAKSQDLVLLQDVFIDGDVLLNDAVIKPGHVGSFYYNAESQQNYNMLNLSYETPNVSLFFRNHLRQLFTGIYQKSASTERFGISQSLINSFDERTIFVYSENDIYIDNEIFDGNVVIQTPGKITISNRADLNDIILISDELEIMSSFKGSIQAFANSSISVQSNVNLTYPSALVLFSKELQPTHKITSKENTIIDGTIAHITQNGVANYPHQSIDLENTMVNGQVYTDQYLSFSGRIEGHIIAQGFMFKHDFNSYINHINDLKMDGQNLSSLHLGLPFTNSSKAVLKWLN